MPNTHRNIFPQSLSFELMHSAWLKARKGRRYSLAVLSFERDLENNLFQLIEEIKTGIYKTSGYREFYVFEPKKRKVARLSKFRDRVVQHAICMIIEPIFDAKFIFNSFACRKNKGTHAGADKAQQLMRKVKRESGIAYALKCDIKKYFNNINHSILKKLIAKTIADKRMQALLFGIIDSYGDDGKGLPLGNLTSQLFANIYLDRLDQHLKQEKSIKNYVRYMDDFIVIHHDKAFLHDIRRHLVVWLDENLALELNNKTAVFPISGKNSRALDFLGYRMRLNSRKLRKESIRKMRSKVNVLHELYASHKIDFKEVKQGMSSHLAHASHASTSAILTKILEKPFTRSYKENEKINCI